MSKEAIEIIRQMDGEMVESQLILQCAPLFAKMKISTIFVLRKRQLQKLSHLLQGSGISCHTLYRDDDDVTVLLYRPQMLAIYLRAKRAKDILHREGYSDLGLEAVLSTFAWRYTEYRQGKQSFPHELGLLLGYPLDDVEGFIANEGKNCLYSGYWKVYANVPAKRHLFGKYEKAREDLILQIGRGEKISKVISNV